MAENRLKIKIGEHEFEAEGPVETVQAQLAAFTELVAHLPSTKAERETKEESPGQNGRDANQLSLEKIMSFEGRVVSLMVRAESIPDAALLILLGQRHFRSNNAVTGNEIMEGLTESGQVTGRVDYVMNRLAAEGVVIIVGQHRGRRYRLTNAGIVRAQEIARALISIVP